MILCLVSGLVLSTTISSKKESTTKSFSKIFPQGSFLRVYRGTDGTIQEGDVTPLH
jgi:hypothetical protein